MYTLMANNVAINAKNIGPNEYEGHHLYDVIYNNKSDVNINMVTGDGHSINKLNYIVLDSIDVAFIPSIKNIREEAEQLYSIKDPSTYTGLIKPKEKIKLSLIKSQKKGILRILLSLIMQENTQSIIIRKLSSHDRYARLRIALLEYNKIFKSIHVLNLINDVRLRKAIKSARNRTEAYHQLQRLIRKVYSGVFKGRKIVDNQVSAQATRLIVNGIIAYNSMLLNSLYKKLLIENANDATKKMFAKISPIAWGHITFTGRYSFKNKGGDIDIESIIKALEEKLKKIYA